ncbi:unnamed protein product [Phytophthora fragariaefolia]|uniref:Unnamed protein product n=1 Tax=Phytophthora fragariaefolia TaxID=1490495 RepID=A0A9W6TLD4_9STRA|nr:unnamed protein product [Phytophthora fragariaefolia]
MERLQLSEPLLAEAKRQASEEEQQARKKANAMEEELKQACKKVEKIVEKVEASGKENVEKDKVSVKRAQDKLKNARDKAASDLRDAELESWGLKKEVEASQTKTLMEATEAATTTNNIERAYLDAQRRDQELRNQEMNARPAAVDKVVIETIPNPYP